MCFVWISEQKAIISLYNINWLVFIPDTECIYCAVRTGPFPYQYPPTLLHTPPCLHVAGTRKANGQNFWTFQNVKFFRASGRNEWESTLTLICCLQTVIASCKSTEHYQFVQLQCQTDCCRLVWEASKCQPCANAFSLTFPPTCSLLV